MGRFKNESNNAAVEQGVFDLILEHISACCETMRYDCRKTGELLYNHENKISNRLVERYLDMNAIGLRFILEKTVHYDPNTDTLKGRTDIAVFSSDTLADRKAYYSIECKRLNGRPGLNKKYVLEGVSRFVTPPSPIYHSYYGKNIMLGYIVKAMNVCENTEKIERFQRELLCGVKVGKMDFECEKNGFSRYKCFYRADGNLHVELTHLFYDFSGAMQ